VVGRSGLTISSTGFPRKELTRKELESLPSVGVPRNPLRPGDCTLLYRSIDCLQKEIKIAVSECTFFPWTEVELATIEKTQYECSDRALRLINNQVKLYSISSHRSGLDAFLISQKYKTYLEFWMNTDL
jgi:hypothetical protein